MKKYLLGNFEDKFIFIFLFQLLAFWQVWIWYTKRTIDISDEPWGLLALFTALFFLLSSKVTNKNIFEQKKHLYILTSMLLIYSLAGNYMADIIKAGLAVMAICYTLCLYKLNKPFNLSILGLLFLSLPIIPSLQFYLGYPLRIFASGIVIFLLKLNGFFVTAEGTCLKWGNQNICIDVPCAGIQMLWTGLYLCFTIAYIYKLTSRETILLFFFSSFAIIMSNVFRATALFYTELKIFNLPDFAHQGIGLVVFFITAVSINIFSQFVKGKKYALLSV